MSEILGWVIVKLARSQAMPERAYQDWLTAQAEQAMRFVTAYPAEGLTTTTPVVDGLF